MHKHSFSGKKLYGTATVGTKGQVVIPADARKELGIEEGDRLYVVGVPEHGSVAFLKEEMLQEIVQRLTLDLEKLSTTLNGGKK